MSMQNINRLDEDETEFSVGKWSIVAIRV